MINHLGLYSNVTPNLSVKQGLIMSQKVGLILGGFHDNTATKRIANKNTLRLGKTIFTNPEIQDAHDLSL